MMSILWKKIEFYKEESNSEANVIAVGGLGGGGCCKPPSVDRFFHYGGTFLPPNLSHPHKSLSFPYCYLKWDIKVKKKKVIKI